MNKTLSLKIVTFGLLIVGTIWFANQRDTSQIPVADQLTDEFAQPASTFSSQPVDGNVVHSDFEADINAGSNIQLCQGYSDWGCETGDPCAAGPVVQTAALGNGFGYATPAVMPAKTLGGVNQYSNRGLLGRESKWHNASGIPFEQFAYGEYIGPHRAPHVPEYRLRVDDELEFVYLRTREKSLEPYRLYVGDQIQISSAIDNSLNQPTNQFITGLEVRSDGMVSLSLIGEVRVAGKTVADLQRELNQRYTKFVKNPAIVVQVIQGNTPLQDLLDSVDARAGTGGQARAVVVSPDGTVQLPGIGSVPAIGLTLKEIAREVNARYRLRQGGIEVTPILIQRAPRFIYVVGEVTTPGRFELVGPTSVLQAIALAEGDIVGGNLRQVIVFRRDQNWRLTATKLDLNGAILGKRPFPSDEIWLRDSDIVLIPRKPIQRFSDAVNLYLANTLYSIFPQQGVAFNFDGFSSL